MISHRRITLLKDVVIISRTHGQCANCDSSKQRENNGDYLILFCFEIEKDQFYLINRL